MMIAGHQFAETHIGRACIGLRSDGTTCFRKWIDIRNTTMADLDQPHIAHVGNTNRGEIEQIMAECKAEDAVIAGATFTAAGFGIGGMAAGAGDGEMEGVCDGHHWRHRDDQRGAAGRP